MTDPRIIGPGLLPTPFTAEEIRDATGKGKTIRIRIDLPDGTHQFRINRFRETDAEGATLERWPEASPEEMTANRVTWAELQGHAAFDAETTSVSTGILSLALGDVNCLRYDTEGGTFWFSLAHPGMPVRYESAGTRTTVVSVDHA
ncbi:hypothetical protein [Microbacterium sp. SD291]|uniref:hypothetical protein n=1 Tax=Microbacterium sp. SD291 TaxID=2782007 RepID=UPI001A97691E|nr:hypothetical protein [Microbacterium sp. SD291]MBO0980641.1 hypothetical protein [Microbacterium sp. SD291]